VVTVAAQDYGVLTDLVAAAGSLMAATGAIGLAWRRRADWEPSEEDIPKGAQRVAGLLAAVAIALLWAKWHDPPPDLGPLDRLAIGVAAATLVSLLIYGYLVGTQTYTKVDGTGAEKGIIGGFWMRTNAKRKRDEEQITTQQLFEGSAYNPDLLWSRPSRQLAKLSFQLAYIGLVGCGTVALAASAIRLALAAG
jgi:hypothetical protein